VHLSLGALDLSDGQRYPLDRSEIPYASLDAIVGELPLSLQGDDMGAMRDALMETVRRLANKIWADTGSALNAFVSPRFASGGMLDVWGVLRQMPRAVNESDGGYRTRLLATADGITPVAIKAAALAIAATFNATLAFQEPATDGEFWTADDPTTEAWCCFWQGDNALYWNYDPTVANPTTGGYWTPDHGAQFWIIMQLGAGSEALTTHWLSDTATVPSTEYDDPQDFWADNVNDYGFWGFDGDPLELQLAADIETRKAFGIAWMLIEDPSLNGAY
jgi:hypothetical protein